MRRRALLAASQTGGGKPTNVLRLKVVSEGIDIGIEFNFDFPPTSQLEVSLLTDGYLGWANIPFPAYIQSGVKHSVDVQASKIQILSYTPTEDDTYIYEVIVE